MLGLHNSRTGASLMAEQGQRLAAPLLRVAVALSLVARGVSVDVHRAALEWCCGAALEAHVAGENMPGVSACWCV
jgi:hypothetical protein